MENDPNNRLITSWLTLTQIQMNIANELEAALQEEYHLSLKEFYLLLFLSEAPDKKLRLQQLETMVGLSQSAMSRLVSRFEAKGCGALQRHICDDDRRGVYTSLTRIGEEKLEKALVTFKAVLEKQLSEVEMQSLLQQFIHLNSR
ncbi:MarR family winged helix-turn-helix transcriptional regulator [Paenibacillus beijingensis]|uniref:MarR family transcriptional regulator n=1 Tax=Paenibacillus beijingensis TaxID=1126833 RepID=A0A0D5NLA2_9BACL|nr:MarR family transcriptional regulator [Paenibacillus beijingensis]AJY75925.1 MarR family transcriptional regulator [Paenibacillus beijingensis]